MGHRVLLVSGFGIQTLKTAFVSPLPGIYRRSVDRMPAFTDPKDKGKQGSLNSYRRTCSRLRCRKLSSRRKLMISAASPPAAAQCMTKNVVTHGD